MPCVGIGRLVYIYFRGASCRYVAIKEHVSSQHVTKIQEQENQVYTKTKRTTNPETRIKMVEAATIPGSNSTFLYVAKYQNATKAPMEPNSGIPTKGNIRWPIRMATFSGITAA